MGFRECKSSGHSFWEKSGAGLDWQFAMLRPRQWSVKGDHSVTWTNSSKAMRIAIFGTGGVGGYFGGRLAQAGEDVTFIARGEHLRAIKANGLKVDSTSGDFTIYPARATDD